ncbi:hypothetical protein MMC31_007739 [Peltigera leucophlebia]|nr:hypothetical protein [Peltigera leucophlebia]
MPVPSWREAEANDYLLVVMRDNGQEWADICEWWKDMTGLDTDVNTLRTTYVRLKFSKILEDGHKSVDELDAEKTYADSARSTSRSSLTSSG